MEEDLYNRIGEADLNPTYKDGQVYQHTDVNNMLSILKLAINENYYDIQRLWNGERSVGNADKLDGATLSRYLNEELQADDNKVPSSQQVMSYINALFEDFSPPIRGVDYWTEEDKLYIIDETANRIIDELKGEYDADTTYEKLNIVFYQGSTYFALRQTKGNLPTNTTYWQLLAKRGDSAYEIYRKHGGTLPEDVWVDEFTNAENFYNKEEVDNKLSLRDLLISQKVYYFDTIASMKAYDLNAGSYVITKGYYQVNDGGGASYFITNTESTEDHQELLNNGSYANIILDTVVNVKQFGAYGDGVHDDTLPIQKALDTKKKVIFGNCQNFYLISESLNVYADIEFKSYIKMHETDGSASCACLNISNYQENKMLNIINPLIDGGRDTTVSYSTVGTEYAHGINIKGSKNIDIVGGNITSCLGDSICISASESNRYCENINVRNVSMDYPFRNNVSVVSGVNILLKDCICYNRNSYRNILIEPNNDLSLKNENIIVDGGYYYGSGSLAVFEIYPRTLVKNVTYKDLIIENASDNTCPFRISSSSESSVNNIKIFGIKINNNNSNMQIILNSLENIDIKDFYLTGAYNSINVKSDNVSMNSINIKNDNLGTISCECNSFKLTDSIINGKHTSSSAYIFSIKCKEALISNNIFENFVNLISFVGGTSSSPYEANNYIINNNIFMGNSSSAAVRRVLLVPANLSLSNLLADNNINKNVDNTYLNQGNVVYATGNNVYKKKVMYGTSAPTEQIYYFKGDICYNTEPSSGGVIGWVCVTAGSPGVWKSFGNIAS